MPTSPREGALYWKETGIWILFAEEACVCDVSGRTEFMDVRTEWCGLRGGKTVRDNCSGEQLSWFFLGLPRLGDFSGKMGKIQANEDKFSHLRLQS